MLFYVPGFQRELLKVVDICGRLGCPRVAWGKGDRRTPAVSLLFLVRVSPAENLCG